MRIYIAFSDINDRVLLCYTNKRYNDLVDESSIVHLGRIVD